MKRLQHVFRLANVRYAGVFGECLAEQWMRRQQVDFAVIDQGLKTKPTLLKQYGGKRPDYFLEPQFGDKKVLFFDAKFHSTNDCSQFAMREGELIEYAAFKQWFDTNSEGAEAEIAFLLFPREEEGRRFVWVHLSEFEAGVAVRLAGSPAVQISLRGKRPEHWEQLTDDIVENAVTEAERRFHRGA